MEQKKLVEQLIKASNKISKNRKPSANYIHLSEEYIQEQANERKISFDNMVEIIKKELTPKTNQDKLKTFRIFVQLDAGVLEWQTRLT